MLAVTVALTSAFACFGLNVLQSPPYVCCLSGHIVAEGTGKRTDQIVEIVHAGGDSVNMEEVKIKVEVYRSGELERACILKNFPWERNKFISPENIEGDQMIDRSRNQKYLGELAGDGIWSVGEKIGFRIKEDHTNPNRGIKLRVGDVVRVVIIHTPSGCVIADKEIVVDVS